MKSILKSAAGVVFLVLFVVAGFAGPSAATQVSIAGFHLVGNVFGATKAGISEIPTGYRETANATKDKSYVKDYPKVTPKAKTNAKD